MTPLRIAAAVYVAVLLIILIILIIFMVVSVIGPAIVALEHVRDVQSGWDPGDDLELMLLLFFAGMVAAAFWPISITVLARAIKYDSMDEEVHSE